MCYLERAGTNEHQASLPPRSQRRRILPPKCATLTSGYNAAANSTSRQQSSYKDHRKPIPGKTGGNFMQNKHQKHVLRNHNAMFHAEPDAQHFFGISATLLNDISVRLLSNTSGHHGGSDSPYPNCAEGSLYAFVFLRAQNAHALQGGSTGSKVLRLPRHLHPSAEVLPLPRGAHEKLKSAAPTTKVKRNALKRCGRHAKVSLPRAQTHSSGCACHEIQL